MRVLCARLCGCKVLWRCMRCLCPRCGDAVSLGGKYVFATVICLVLPMCILISCSSVLCVLMALGIFMFVKVCRP